MFDQILLTGFKVFGGCEVNPTQLLAQHFIEHPRKGVTCSVVEVTAKDADAYIEKAKEKVLCSKGKKILNLHFGVGPNTVYELEQMCFNNKDFEIPDNLGYKPRKQQITKTQALNYPIHTKVDIKGLHEALSKDFKVEISNDPGRFLCNYIYFKSSYDLSLNNVHCFSLFVHFPDLEISPHERNVEFVKKMFDYLLKKEYKK